MLFRKQCYNAIDSLTAGTSFRVLVGLKREKGKDVEIKVYTNAHHGFDAKMVFRGGKTKSTSKDYGYGICYLEENTDSSVLNEENLGEGFHQIITQVGFNEWLASAKEKKKKKLFKWIKRKWVIYLKTII